MLRFVLDRLPDMGWAAAMFTDWRVNCVAGAAYSLTSSQAEEDLLAVAAELRQMCMQVVELAIGSDEVMDTLGIAPSLRDAAVKSWNTANPSLCERLDLIYDGRGPAKLIECNAENPGDIVLAGPFQRRWVEHCLAGRFVPNSAFQLSPLQDRLVAAFRRLWPVGTLHHFTALAGEVEDWSEVSFLADCAQLAGMDVERLDFEYIRPGPDGAWLDIQGRPIKILHKRLSWDKLEPALGPGAPMVIEPAWKVVLESKGILPWLWRLFPGHPNLLPAWFADDDNRPALPISVSKPLWSRRGFNVVIEGLPQGRLQTGGPFLGKRVTQAHQPLPEFDDGAGGLVRALAGVWIVDGMPAGIRMAETRDHILTADQSLFVPYFIDDRRQGADAGEAR